MQQIQDLQSDDMEIDVNMGNNLTPVVQKVDSSIQWIVQLVSQMLIR